MSRMYKHGVTEADLLLYADGELSAELSREGAHLAGCAVCRDEVAERERVVRAYAEISGRLVPAWVHAPGASGEPLNARIDAWENRLKARSLIGRLRVRPQLSWRLAGTLAAVLSLAVLLMQPWQETVSASELLRNACAEQSASLKRSPGLVLHEALKIRRRSILRGEDTSADYESWRDAAGREAGHASFRDLSSSPALIAEIQRVYQENGLDWKAPLSATAYEGWRTGLAEARDSVARTGRAQLTLTTVVGGETRQNAITKAQLVVRARDWRPMAMRLRLRDFEYEIEEVSTDATPVAQAQPATSEAPAETHETAGRIKTAGRSERVQGTATVQDEPQSAVTQGVLAKPDSGRDETSMAPSLMALRDSANDTGERALDGAPSSTAAKDGAAPSTKVNAATPTSPTLRVAATLLYRTETEKSLQLPPRSDFVEIAPPTRFPLALKAPRRLDCGNSAYFKELATKIGLIKKKKNEPVETTELGE